MAWLWPCARDAVLKCAATMANTLVARGALPVLQLLPLAGAGFQWIKDKLPQPLRAAAEGREGEAARPRRRHVGRGGPQLRLRRGPRAPVPLRPALLHRQNFGVRCRVGWLIDTFGYTWTFPQILKESGLDYFVSTKPTWNDTNTFPFTTFWWESPDGSRVLTHIPPLTYGARHRGGAASVEALDKNKEARLGIGPHVLFGRSDGGGGPRVVDIENMARIEASPYVAQGRGHHRRRVVQPHRRSTINFPVFCDEMYVETHRGTYTSQARTKRNNRKAECALFAAEAAATAAMLLGAKYPQAKLEEAWKMALFNQFHDILPGSSIGTVYKDADADYAKVFEMIGEGPARRARVRREERSQRRARARRSSCSTLRHGSARTSSRSTRRGARATRSTRKAWRSRRSGRPTRRRLAVLVTVPSCGWTVVHVVRRHGPGRWSRSPRSRGAELRDDALLACGSTPPGRSRGSSTRRPGARSLPRARPATASRCSRTSRSSTRRGTSTSGTEDKIARGQGPRVHGGGRKRPRAHGGDSHVARAAVDDHAAHDALRATRGASTSSTEVDWRERKTLLKAAFPTTVRARQGDLRDRVCRDRPLRRTRATPGTGRASRCPRTSGADLSQADYGVSFLNDSKYGYDTHDNVMRLSLLRSPEAPDPDRPTRGARSSPIASCRTQGTGATPDGYRGLRPQRAADGDGSRRARGEACRPRGG